jgi:hypothetical protein
MGTKLSIEIRKKKAAKVSGWICAVKMTHRKGRDHETAPQDLICAGVDIPFCVLDENNHSTLVFMNPRQKSKLVKMLNLCNRDPRIILHGLLVAIFRAVPYLCDARRYP